MPSSGSATESMRRPPLSSVRPRFAAAPGDRLPLTAVPGAGGTMARPGDGAAPLSLPLRVFLEGPCLLPLRRPGGAALGPCGRPAVAAWWALSRVKWGGPDRGFCKARHGGVGSLRIFPLRSVVFVCFVLFFF